MPRDNVAAHPQGGARRAARHEAGERAADAARRGDEALDRCRHRRSTCIATMEAVLHLFISRRDWPGPAQALAADIGAAATLYNEPFPEAPPSPASTARCGPGSRSAFPRARSRRPACPPPSSTAASTTSATRWAHRTRATSTASWCGAASSPAARARCRGSRRRQRRSAAWTWAMRRARECSSTTLPKGSRVRKGMPVCEIIDPADARGPKARTQVLARTDGVLFCRKPDGRLAWPGAVAVPHRRHAPARAPQGHERPR